MSWKTLSLTGIDIDGDGGDLGWCLVVVVHQLKGEYARGPTTCTHHLQKVAIIFISDKIR